MAKEIINVIKLQVVGGKANPAPPVGTALGPAGVNIMEFCKQFNERTKDNVDVVIPCVITVYKDRTFTFITKTPPASVLILKALKIDKGSGVPNRDKKGKLSKEQVKEIAQLKMKDLNANDINAAMRIVAGTARSMGVDVDLPEAK